jgi:hypothetical protein
LREPAVQLAKPRLGSTFGDHDPDP